MTGTPRTAGRLIADALAAAGVRVAYTVPGESFLPLLDGLVGAGIRVVAARHEGGAAFMAAASASLSGHPAAVLGTRAVGAANLAIGLHVAHADSLPVIALVGQVERSERGREGFQEVDLAGTIGGFCRWAREVRDASALPAALDEALRRATSGRPGPVLLSLPEDLLGEEVPGAAPRPVAPTLIAAIRLPPPDPVHVRRALHLLLDAERPVILAGGGVLRSRGTADLVRFSEFVDVPVIASWRRPDVFPNDNPRYLGMSGYFSAPTVRHRLEEADAILVIGCRLNEVASYGHAIPAPGTRWVHVDVEPLGSRPGLTAPTVAVTADARTFLREARRVLGSGVLDAAGLERRRAALAIDRAAYEEARRVDQDAWDGPGVHPGRVVATLNRVLSPDTIVTTDAGNFGGWAARGLVLRRPGTFLGTTAGAMGFAIPAAVAASLAGPGRPVVALAGDGGAAMTIAELETAVRVGVRPVVLVFDNEQYGTIHDHQVQRGLAAVATDLGPVDWSRVAEGYGALGVRVERDEDVEPAIRAALGAALPTVIHLVVDRRWASVDRFGDVVPTVAPFPDEPDARRDPGISRAQDATMKLDEEIEQPDATPPDGAPASEVSDHDEPMTARPSVTDWDPGPDIVMPFEPIDQPERPVEPPAEASDEVAVPATAASMSQLDGMSEAEGATTGDEFDEATSPEMEPEATEPEPEAEATEPEPEPEAVALADPLDTTPESAPVAAQPAPEPEPLAAELEGLPDLDPAAEPDPGTPAAP